MSVLNEVADYLEDKVLDSKFNKNTGVQYLRDNYRTESILGLVYKAVHTIQSRFSRSTSQTEIGEARLTNISHDIGSSVVFKDDNLGVYSQWELEIRVGDLFVEAFYNTELIDLYYPQTRNSFHIVTPTKRWPLLEDIPEDTVSSNIKGTVFEKPEDITGLIQAYPEEDKPIVKNRVDPIDISQTWVKSINKLQQTGWRINDRILKALLENEDMFISREEIKDNKLKEVKRRSKLIEWTFITKKAKLFKDQTFYQLIEADYRGRLYYCEHFLNFQGSDVARGLLTFAKCKPMDKHGLYWLAVHAACSYNESYSSDAIPDWCEEDYAAYLKSEGLDSISVDKMTLNDRVNWFNNNSDWVRKLGKSNTFEEKAEKPVAFLAACIEWDDYNVAIESDQIYRTSLPIPIDGSNNGWQHLGAISKDTQTGELVGLTPVNIQKDFYVQTAKELYTLSDGDLKELLDRMPMKHIRKGISKRGSMTRAYSAGASKIGENMWSDCNQEDFHEIYGITEDQCMRLAKLLVKAIKNVCPGPLETMGYLQSLAAIAIKDNDVIEWTSPSGFPIRYECYYEKECKAEGTISGYTKYNKKGVVKHVGKVYTDFPDVRGFMCGISPNFIHSMDAAHMALVIDKWNGDFGAVHDSFSTHAVDVEHLLAHTKNEFVSMYDTENFYKHIEDQLIEDTTELTVDRPELGTLDIQEVYDSDYFFA